MLFLLSTLIASRCPTYNLSPNRTQGRDARNSRPLSRLRQLKQPPQVLFLAGGGNKQGRKNDYRSRLQSTSKEQSHRVQDTLKQFCVQSVLFVLEFSCYLFLLCNQSEPARRWEKALAIGLLPIFLRRRRSRGLMPGQPLQRLLSRQPQLQPSAHGGDGIGALLIYD
jgi:hypothetical protein